MINIGLTGGIASGKGVVAQTWAKLPGVVVKDADEVVHALYQPGSPLCDRLAEAFGRSILDSNGGIDRKSLGGIVFGDAVARQKLNALVHPAVRQKYVDLAAEAQDRGTDVFVIEAALLLDSDPDHSFFYAFVLTDVDDEEQLKRITQRDGLSREEALKRVRAQRSQSERRKRADYVIDTSGTLEQTRIRARQLLKILRKRFA